VTTAATAAMAEGTATARPGLSTSAGRVDPEAAGAFVGELFAEHGRMVLGLCRLLLRDAVEADDAAQQVFLSAHKALLRGSVPHDASRWLAAIARNECRARIRARMRAPLALPELPSDLPDPLVAAIRAADLQAVWAALGTLPRRQRRAFVLRELGGLSYDELGRALGVSHSAVESLLFRARQQLRSLVAGVAPLAVRDQLAQAIPGFDPGSTGIVARAASFPIAFKLAGAAVGVGVVASGAGGLQSASVATAPVAPRRHAAVRIEQPARHVARAMVRQRPPAVQRATVPVRRHREAERGRGTEHPEAAEHAERQEQPSSVEASHEGPGPAPAEPAQVEPSHEGPGDGGGQADTIEEHSGSDQSGGDGGGSGHSGPG
jgi:RNA polymerase sigma-70 factor (ECF subfamily)